MPPSSPRSRSDSDETYALDDVSVPSSASRYYDHLDDEYNSDFFDERTRRTYVGRAMLALGLRGRSLKSEYHKLTAPEDILDGVLRPQAPPRESRRGRRRTRVASLVKKAVLVSPVVLLICFGVLHILQVLIGRASLLWDPLDSDDDFLPNWGKHGHAGAGLSQYPTDATRDVLPIRCHSHNDYWRRVPFFEAIYWGCTSVEADVWLFDDDLYIGHNLASLARNRTFTSLYVTPLLETLDKMNPQTDFANASGHGVFDVKPEQTLTLLVDFKTDGKKIFPVLQRQLQPLRDRNLLSYWDGDSFVSRAVTVVGTGNTPFNLVTAIPDSHRDIFFDAPLDQLWEPSEPNNNSPASSIPQTAVPPSTSLPHGNRTGSSQGKTGTEGLTSADAFNPSNSYYASTSFSAAVGFVWRGHLSRKQMEILRGQIRGAKRRGLKARYWETPAWPVSTRNHVWHVLMKEGADVLSVDDLRSAAVESWKMRIHDFWR